MKPTMAWSPPVVVS
jgi:phosphatidylinositol 4-phosphatase